MPLPEALARKRITKPLNGEALKRAQEDNDRQRFHAALATCEKDAGPYLARFLDWVKSVLQNDKKFGQFEKLLRFPLPSSRMIDKASDEYLRAFAAEDKYVDMEFSTDDVKADALEYLESIGFDDFLQKSLFNQQLRASAAVWIVDLPALPNASGYATPVPILRDYSGIIDISWDAIGRITYVIFPLEDLRDEDNRVIATRRAVVDDESYRVFQKANGDQDYTVIINNPHQLGRCPAGFIWHDKLDDKNPLRVQSPVHALFSDLDYYVAGSVFRQHADLYASFPILWRYKSRCRFQIGEETCENGKIVMGRDKTDENGVSLMKVIDCPACAARKPIGPGSEVDIPAPADRESADLREPAGFINSERTLLDYNAEKLSAMEDDIREALTGDTNNVDQTGNAVNQDQVQARFEARKAIISYWAREVEQTDQELREVLLALRYGPQFISCITSYGTEFHLLSAAQAIADYDSARKSGLPMYQLATRRQRIDKLLMGASESALMRSHMLAQLEPYTDLPLSVIPSGSDEWELKANFSKYIARFERENMGLEIFGKDLPMSTRITKISQILYDYVKADKARRDVPQPAGSGAGFTK